MNEYHNETQPLAEMPPEESKLKSQLNTVTPFSKYLAMILFVLLPIVGLLVGYEMGSKNKIVTTSVTETVFVEKDKLEKYDSGSINNVDTTKEDQVTLSMEEDESDDVVENQMSSKSLMPVKNGERFFFRYYGEVPGPNCTKEKRYLDCVTAMGLMSGYRLPAEFDPSREDSLFIDFCNFGYQEGEQVDNLYCEGEYTEVIPRQVSESGMVEIDSEQKIYACTFEINDLVVTSRESDYAVLEGLVLNPDCSLKNN